MYAEDLLLGASAALLSIGGLAATTSASALKRVIGIALALIGAIGALAALGVSQTAMVAGAAAAFAFVALGVAIVARLQEAYGASSVAEFEAADRDSEPVGRDT